MTATQFILASVITGLILLIIRIFWQEIHIIGTFLYILGHLTLWSLISAILWVGFIIDSTAGWGWVWLYFFFTYTGICIVYALIVTDIIGMAFDFLKDIFR